MLNITYGLLSRFIKGGFFVLLGGDLTGLMVENNDKRKRGWVGLITQMVAGGIPKSNLWFEGD